MSETIVLHVDNLKCGGCANTIQKSLGEIVGVSALDVRPGSGEVRFNADPDLRPRVAATLRAIGYPETGTVSGLAANVANVKSYVSCALGKMT